MKFPRLSSIVYIFPIAIISLITFLFIAQWVVENRYKNRWIERFSEYSETGSIPEQWKNHVAKRTLPSGEWMLAAMYHGSCVQGPEGEFDASVILDSSGTISVNDWSPCAGGISEIAEFWLDLQPATSLADFYQRYPDWTEVGRIADK